MNKHSEIRHYTSYSETKSNEYHFHFNYEIMYVTDGSVIMYSNGARVRLTPGMACIIPAFTPHKTQYTDADVIHILFDGHYIENYISEDTIKQFHEGFSTNVSVSKKNNLKETIEMLIDEIDLYGGESAYIYLYKIIMACILIHNKVHKEDKIISRAMHYIGINSKSKITLDEIARECGVSKFHICRLFRNELGITPVDYITFAKIRRAVTRLNTTNYTIARISDGLSFYSPKYFTKIFKSYFGVSPSKFRKMEGFEIKERYYLKGKTKDV